MADDSQPDALEPSKRFIVYKKGDHTKWFSLDASSSQCWQLESQGSDWDPFDGYFRITTERTLYRLSNKAWVLVEVDSHVEVNFPGDSTYEVLNDADAAEQLVRGGHVPPEDVIHLVQDKLAPPLAADSNRDDETDASTSAAESADDKAENATPANDATIALADAYGLLPPKVRLVDYGRLAVIEDLRLPHEDEAIGHCYDRSDFAQSFLYRLADGRFVLHSWDHDDPHKGKKAYLLTLEQATQWMENHDVDIAAEVKSLLTAKIIAEKENELTELNLVDFNELDIDQAIAVGARAEELKRQIDAHKGRAQPENGQNPPASDIDPDAVPDRGQVSPVQAAANPVETNGQPTGGNDDGPPALTFEPGAFIYRGHKEALSGKPLQVLHALWQAQGKTLTLDALQSKVWTDTTTGQETVRSAVSTARKALRRAIEAKNINGPADPLPLADRGQGLTAWRLDLP